MLGMGLGTFVEARHTSQVRAILGALLAFILVGCSSGTAPETEDNTSRSQQAVTGADAGAAGQAARSTSAQSPSGETPTASVSAQTQESAGSGAAPNAGAQKVPFKASGTLLGSVDVGDGNVVQFRDTPNAGIVTITGGPNTAPEVDNSRLVGKSVTDLYRGLAGAEPPKGLVDAEKRYGAQAIRSGETDNAIVAPPKQEATFQNSKVPGGVSPMWSWDPTFFQSNYCNGVGQGYGTTWDQGWCPLNVAWAHSGWGAYQKAYRVCGGTTNTAGTLWYDKWVNGTWQRQLTWDVPTNFLGCLNAVGVGYYRSGLDTGGGANYSERFRFAIPTISQYIGDFPNDVNYSNFSGNWQGLTHDQNNWYMSMYEDNGFPFCNSATRGNIGSMSLTGPANDPLRSLYYGPQSRVYVPALQSLGLNHFGDLVQVNGRLYIGVTAGGSTSAAAVAVFSTSMAFIGFAFLDNWSGGIAGIAYNPRDGLFYASQGGSTVKGYTITVNGSTVSANYARTVYLNYNANYVAMNGTGQGGKATPSGNLYWSDGYGSSPYGIWAIDLFSGYVQWYYAGPHGASDEFQGLDIYDTDTDPRFGVYTLGQIHLMQFGLNCGGNSSYWLSHFRVNDPARL